MGAHLYFAASIASFRERHLKRFITGICLALGLSLSFAGLTHAQNAERAVPASAVQIQLSFAPLVKQSAPAVVNIFTRAEVSRSPLGGFGEDLLGSPFSRQTEKVQTALGSGVIVSADGLVVTNYHVISEGTEVEVVLSDKREFVAEVLFTDSASDLALLQIDPEGDDLPILNLGDSDGVEIGDLVLAIGNPFGVGQTTTMGIVSALARTDVGITEVGSFIQTDASINPGNSGGALVDMNGNLIGINTAIYSQSGSSAGIGFAIPANFVANTLRALENGGGKVVRPWLGITGEDVTQQMANILDLDGNGGFLVNDVYDPSPAFDAGIQTGDVILSLDSAEILSTAEMRYAIASSLVGDTMVAQVYREGDIIDIVLNLSAPPEVPAREETQLTGRHPLQGASVINLSPAVSQELDLPGKWTGVVISEVPSGSIAARQGFKAGDVIRSANREIIETVEDLELALEEARSRRWSFILDRGGRTVTYRLVY